MSDKEDVVDPFGHAAQADRAESVVYSTVPVAPRSAITVTIEPAGTKVVLPVCPAAIISNAIFLHLIGKKAPEGLSQPVVIITSH
jgi:hypothetical protein